MDPWLSGHSISYYYFGYVMVAFLTKSTGLASADTFNLAIAMLFGFTLTGAYGVVAQPCPGLGTRCCGHGTGNHGPRNG